MIIDLTLKESENTNKIDAIYLICITDKNEAIKITNIGFDGDLFANNSIDLSDDGLIIPENIIPGVYKCSNFYTSNHSHDRETGFIDDYDIQCNWELIYKGEINDEKAR